MWTNFVTESYDETVVITDHKGVYGNVYVLDSVFLQNVGLIKDCKLLFF